jgi:sigma-B regulation protein RsbU (phosphoserine phosphatase)
VPDQSSNTGAAASARANLSLSGMQALLDSVRLLNASLDLQDLLNHLARTVMGRLLVTRIAVAIEEKGEMRVALARGVPGLAKGTPLTQAAAAEKKLENWYTIGPPEHPMGALALGKPALGEITPEQHQLLLALLEVAETAVLNARAHEETVRTNRALDQNVQELNAVLDLARGLASKLDAEEIAHLLALTLAGRWTIRRHALAAWRSGHAPVTRQRGIRLPDLAVLQAAAAELTEPAYTTDTLPTAVREALAIEPGSAVFPIRSSEEAIGIVICGPRMAGGQYAPPDLAFGAGLIAQAAVAFENAWRLEDIVARKQMEQELSIAAGIQESLFPSTMPPMSCSDLAARNRQARQVGGDYYDVLPIDRTGCDSHLLCVADISGKGLPAALLMANIQATLRATIGTHQSLSALATRVNVLLYASTPSNKFATAFLLAYDPATGACAYVNGGHNDGIVLRQDGSVQLLETTGMPLGLFARAAYEEGQVELGPGDLLMLYSDGVTEAEDNGEEQFGMDRVVDVLRTHRDQPAAGIVDQMLLRLDEFAGTAPQHDDITLMILKRN